MKKEDGVGIWSAIIVLAIGLMLSISAAQAIYQCGDQTDTCYCGKNNPMPCCDNNCNGENDICDGNCAWWAWEQACCNWGIGLPDKVSEWDNGRLYSKTEPVVNAIAIRCGKVEESEGDIRCASGEFKHAAYVIWVSDDKTKVNVSEMNCWRPTGTEPCPGDPGYKGCSGKPCSTCETTGHSYRYKVYDANYFSYYIYPPKPPASAINITDAEAIYETDLINVSVPTVPTPVTKIFMFATEAFMEKGLKNVSVPTKPVPVNEIFMHLVEASTEEGLFSVSVPTNPTPLSIIFMHKEEASMEEALINPQMCKIEIYTDKTNYTAGDVMCLGLNVTNPGDAMRAGIKIWLNTPTGRNFTLLNTIVTLPSGLEYANPCFKRFKLPAIPAGNYTWYALIYEPSTEARISEDNASWYFAGKGGSQERIYELLKQETPRIHFE